MDNIMLIQITNNKAIKLLRDLEDLNIIKVIKENISESKKLSDKYIGSISKEEGEKLENHINHSRNEWSDI